MSLLKKFLVLALVLAVVYSGFLVFEKRSAEKSGIVVLASSDPASLA